MRYFAIVCLGLLLPALQASGQARPVVLKGTLGVEGGEVFTYRLVLTEADSGRFTGEAQTWLQEAHDSKASVTGTIDRKKKTLTFEETGILHNNNFQSKAILCLLRANLQYKYGSEGFTLSGPVTSIDLAMASCAKGSLVFAAEDVLKALFAAPPPRTDSAKATATVTGTTGVMPVTRPVAAPPARPMIVKDLLKITRDVAKTFDWTTDTIVLELWDGGRGDGDVVSIGYNGMPVLSRYRLTEDKRQLRLPLSGRAADELVVIAENEGGTPEAIAYLTLTDGNIQYPVIANNKAGRTAVMKFQRAGRKR